MNYLAQIQRGIDFIEAHLDGELKTATVARHARVSHWHFQRMFKALTGDTLKGYIRSRRLANALVTLHEPGRRILDVAFCAGFESHAAFTRAFVRAFGTTPARYRALGTRTEFVRKVRIDRDYLLHIQANVSLRPKIVVRPRLSLVGLRTSFFGIDSDKSNMGEKLPPLWDGFLARAPEIDRATRDEFCGVVIPSRGQEKLDYVAAVRAPRSSRLPKSMVRVEVPSATYAEFMHRGLPEDLHRTVSYIYSSWLLASRVRHTYGPDLELYDERYVPGSKDSVIRYAIPITRRPAAAKR